MSAETNGGSLTVVTVERVGRKWTATFPNGRTGHGYTVMAQRDAGDGRVSRWVCGFAVQTQDKRGWIVLDHETGEVVLGAGDSTKVGFGLGDALWVYGNRLTKQGAR